MKKLNLDITGRGKTEAALIRARQQFNGLVNTVNGIVWEADAQTFAFNFVSDQAAVLLGYPVQQWLDEPTFWEDHIHPDDRQWAVSFCEKNVRENKSHKFEYRMIAADGSVLWLQDIVSVILENDKPPYITGLMIDITERKIAEQKIVDSERRYRSLFEQNLAGVYRTTAGGKILACNNAFAAMLGYDSANDLLDKKALDLYYSDSDRNRFLEVLRKQRKIYNSEFVLKRKDNSPLFILENISLSEDPLSGEELIDGVMIDITEKIELEEKLAQEKLQKHQEITQAAITAQEQQRKQLGEELHDNINQVLATARLYLESAIADTNPRKDLMMDSKNYIISAMNEIRELSRSLLPPSLGLISLTEALADLLETINRVNKLKCITKWDALDETLISEKLKLTIFRIAQEQMNNIITHANAKTVTIQLLNKGNDIQLLIKDDGIGFDPLQKRKGVGLQNITSRAELFRGNVSIKASPGKGCELIIDFKLN